MGYRKPVSKEEAQKAIDETDNAIKAAQQLNNRAILKRLQRQQKNLKKTEKRLEKR